MAMGMADHVLPGVQPWTSAPDPCRPSLSFDAATLACDYNRRPFLFRHTLHEHPDLRLDALHDLALRLDPKHVRHHCANVPVTADFMRAGEQHPTGLPLAYTMKHMDTAGSYVLIANPQEDAAFGRLFGDLIGEVRAHVGHADPGFHEHVAYIFVSSPGAITPFHLDREINFLCQIRGHKVVHLFDPNDRTLLSDAALDRVMFQPFAPRPVYREAFEAGATQWRLKPGQGVHHPYLAPHWVQNGDEVSVSLAITYRTAATARQVRARSMNFLLRRLGLTPRGFGETPWVDSLKAAVYGVIEPVRPLAAQSIRRLRRSSATA